MLLRKAEEIEVDPNDPWANDCLRRKPIGDRLTKLVTATEQPFVLSIEASWGRGKTSFVRMWKADLEAQGHLCLMFNAWEVDFVQDPLVAFLGETDSVVRRELKKLTDDSETEQLLEKLKRTGTAISRRLPSILLQALSLKILGGEDVGEILAGLTEKGLQDYEKSKQDLNLFKELLQELSYSVTEWKGYKPPVVFFVDELDRCRPDFAVEVLERIKHLFSVERMVFVLSLDRHQLNESVRLLYGSRMDVGGYLRRFIDWSFPLPDPETNAFVDLLCKQFDIQGPGSGLRESFTAMADVFALSLRDQEQCFTQINLILKSTSGFNGDVLSFVVCLRMKRPEIYEKLKYSGGLSTDDWTAIRGVLGRLRDPFEGRIVKASLYGFLTEADKESLLAQEIEYDENHGELPHMRFQELIKKLPQAITALIERLELASEFTNLESGS